jgi:magnesium transporter
LYINLGTAFLAAWVVSLFDATIAQVAILAAMQSIVAGQGGNAATQTITILVRGLALGEVELKDVWQVLLKGVALGFLQGVAIGVVVGIGVTLWQHNPVLGFVIGVSMIGNLVVAGLTGTAVPFILKAFRIDPALASAVIVTTFTDCCGFAFSLGLATILLNYLK